jgi:very-short-patch-repair endonuclease
MEQSPKAVAFARDLRRNDTEAERRLWEQLRSRRLSGYKFRRQMPVPPYIADFACISAKLIVEVDGATHSNAHELRHDEARAEFLESKGFIVHRVPNHEVFTNMDGVLYGILLHLKQRTAR